MIIWTVTMFCIAVKVLVVGVPVFVVDFRMDMAERICEGNKEGRKKKKLKQIKQKLCFSFNLRCSWRIIPHMIFWCLFMKRWVLLEKSGWWCRAGQGSSKSSDIEQHSCCSHTSVNQLLLWCSSMLGPAMLGSSQHSAQLFLSITCVCACRIN